MRQTSLHSRYRETGIRTIVFVYSASGRRFRRAGDSAVWSGMSERPEIKPSRSCNSNPPRQKLRFSEATGCAPGVLLPTGLPDYVFGLLVLPDPNETAVTQVVVRSPLHEFESAHEHRLQPPALFHLLGSKSLPPAAGLRFRQVREGALLHFQAP